MRPEKKAITEEIGEQLGSAGFIFLANYQGLSVELMTELRARLRQIGARVHVVKNAFLERAAKEIGWKGISGYLEGPTAVIVGNHDVTQAAKLLRKFTSENKFPVLKGGRLDSHELSAEDIQEMARIPNREVLLGRLVGTVSAPIGQLVGVMGQKILSLLYVLKEVEKKKDG